MTRRTRRDLLVAAALALVGAVLVQTVPQGVDADFDPFYTDGRVGDRVAVRAYTARVDEVHLAREVTIADRVSPTRGAWVVVMVTAAATLEIESLDVSLEIGDRRFAASSSGDTIVGTRVVPGLAQAGTAMFEVPADVQSLPGASDALLVIGRSDARLDGAIRVHLDLTAATVEPSVEAPGVEWVSW